MINVQYFCCFWFLVLVVVSRIGSKTNWEIHFKIKWGVLYGCLLSVLLVWFLVFIKMVSVILQRFLSPNDHHVDSSSRVLSNCRLRSTPVTVVVIGHSLASDHVPHESIISDWHSTFWCWINLKISVHGRGHYFARAPLPRKKIEVRANRNGRLLHGRC